MSKEIVYVCNRCGYAFPLEEVKVQRYEEGDVELCPICRSSDIEEGKRCEVCGEIHYEHEIEHGVCKACFADAVAAYKHYLDYLQPWEREVLDDAYGNIDITERD